MVTVISAVPSSIVVTIPSTAVAAYDLLLLHVKVLMAASSGITVAVKVNNSPGDKVLEIGFNFTDVVRVITSDVQATKISVSMMVATFKKNELFSSDVHKGTFKTFPIRHCEGDSPMQSIENKSSGLLHSVRNDENTEFFEVPIIKKIKVIIILNYIKIKFSKSNRYK